MPLNGDLIGQRLPGRHADRRRRHRAALRPGPPRAAQRLQPLLPVEGQSLRQGRDRAQPDEVRRHQVLHRQPGLPLPLDGELRLPVRGPVRRRRSRRSTPTTRSSASTSRTTGARPGGSPSTPGSAGTTRRTSSTTTTSRRPTSSPPSRASCPSNYFTDGDDRPGLQGRLPAAPRLLLRPQRRRARRSLFGGYGRYYDRVLYNSGLDERFRLQFARAHVPLLGRRRAARRPADPRLGPDATSARRAWTASSPPAAPGTPRSS